MNEMHLERLCNAVYIEELLPCAAGTFLGRRIEDLRSQGAVPSTACMTQEEWDVILDDLTGDTVLSALTIADFIDYPQEDKMLPGFRAVCFSDGESAYVVFRGTCGDAEWKDNGRGMLETETTYQQAAARYVEQIRENPGIPTRELVVAGHSKGGNKAQYAFITTDATGCFSLDGQGFSQAFLDTYREQIAQKAEKIVSYAERRDFVNCLGFYIQKPQLFKGRRGDTVKPEFPEGQPLPYFHCPDSLRDRENKLGKPAETGYIPLVLNQLVTYLLSSPAYEEEREETVMSIVSLMTRNQRVPDKELVEAIAVTAVVFVDIIVHSHEFDANFARLLVSETRVINASLRALVHRKPAGSDETLHSLIVHEIAKKCHQREQGVETMNHFINSSRHILTASNGVDATGLDEIEHFLGSIEGVLQAE